MFGIFSLIALALLASAFFLEHRLVQRHMHLWLAGYLTSEAASLFRRVRNRRKTHVFLFITDHFEPRFGNVPPEQEIERVKHWCEAYSAFAARFRDSNGRPPQHTWFYPFDEKNDECLEKLNGLVQRGFGEIEFHLHHSGDNEATLRQKIRDGLQWFGRYGATRSREGKHHFGFIHGMFALANSDPRYCGVKEEIEILKSLGCYCDFTFAAFGTPSQPRIVNQIYYPYRNGGHGKPYDEGFEMEKGSPRLGMPIFPGPLSWDLAQMRFDDGRIEPNFPLSPRRLRNWLRANIHVKGRPEWVFIKLYSHSAREKSRDALFSKETYGFYDFLTREASANNFVLHFVTAREAFNIAKAAEGGEEGDDPLSYSDYKIGPPVNRVNP